MYSYVSVEEQNKQNYLDGIQVYRNIWDNKKTFVAQNHKIYTR